MQNMDLSKLNPGVFIVMGFPGSGKTSVAKYLVNKVKKIQTMTTDQIRLEMRLPARDENEQITETVYERLALQALSSIETKKTPILDATFYKKKLRDIVYNILKNKVKNMFLILIEADKNVCKERIFGRKNKSTYHGVDDVTVFSNILRVFEVPAEDEMNSFTGWLRVASNSMPRQILSWSGDFPERIIKLVAQSN